MLRKKHNLIQSRETAAPKTNAKVTVQYIQPQRHLSATKHIITTAAHSAAEEMEVENIEYLEEHPNGEDFHEDHSDAPPMKDEEFEDIFYPNAIHCLLDLYRDKYENVIIKRKGNEENKTAYQLWHDIAKEMQESYFEFEAEQIRQKYSTLRQQYFNLKSSNDVENFEYFPQMHEIYKDPGREIIATGEHVGKIVSHMIYKDEIMVQTVVCDGKEKVLRDDFKSEEIVHKEHEFIDMVEKELQALEEVGNVVEQKHELVEEKANDEPVKEEIETAEIPEFKPALGKNTKRPFDEVSPHEPVQQKPKLEECVVNETTTNTANHCPDTLPANNDVAVNKSQSEFTLFHYNEHQERRHREQVQLLQQQQQQQRDQLTLLEKSLRLHEKSLEEQNQLLQELIKRLPPA